MPAHEQDRAITLCTSMHKGYVSWYVHHPKIWPFTVILQTHVIIIVILYTRVTPVAGIGMGPILYLMLLQ